MCLDKSVDNDLKIISAKHSIERRTDERPDNKEDDSELIPDAIGVDTIPAEKHPSKSDIADSIGTSTLSNSIMMGKNHYSPSSRSSLMKRLVSYLLLICIRFSIRLIINGLQCHLSQKYGINGELYIEKLYIRFGQ